MDETRLQGILARFNPWWRGDPVQNTLYADEHRRRDFDRLIDRIRDKQIVTLCGPRQVGKSTMMGQVVDTLLECGHSPRRILYMTTEAGTISSNYDEILADTLSVYEERILGISFNELDTDAYILIDEVQKANDWADIVKLYADRYDRLHFLVSGSVSTLITDETNETLVGRAHEQVMVPMKFVDYLRYEEVLDEREVSEQSRTLRADIKSGVKSGESNEVALALSNAYTRLDTRRPEIRDSLERYLLRGGYPGYFGMNDVDALRGLDEDLYRVVRGDLASVFSVDKRDELMKVLRYFADCSGNKISINRISNEYGLDRQTVERYVQYLEEFFLVYRCQHYTSGARESRKQPMAYISDVGHLNALLGTSPQRFPGSETVGPILETAVCDHLRRLQFNLSGFRNSTVLYSERTGEIDFVLDGPEYLMPVEVKHGDSESADLSAISQFLAQEPDALGFVVNGTNTFAHDDRLIHIPDWLFFYLC